MGSGGTTALLPPDKFFSNLPNFNLKSGADTQSRTGDLTLTKGALYQLSHISTLLYRQLENKYDWLTSDTAVDEALLINEYTFTEAGLRAG